jgi:hypothetical protein
MMKRISIYIFLISLLMFSCKQNKTWDNAKIENTRASYKDYLKQYPNGKFADSAIFYVEKIEWQEAAFKASEDTEEFILATKSARRKLSVVPYGKDKLITIFNPTILSGNQIEISFKLETEFKEDLVLISSFTEGNIAVLTSSFYYNKSSYDFIKNKIKLVLRSESWIRGKVKVSFYFVTMQELNARNDRCIASSNVVSLYKNY